MISLGVFGRKCPSHPKNVISDICMFPNCNCRVLCSVCRNDHDISHRYQVKPITHFLQCDIKAEMRRIKDIFSEINTFHEKIRLMFDDTLNKIKLEFEDLLEKKREQIREVIQPKKVKEETYWQNIEQDLLDIQKECLTSHDPNTDHGYILLESYIEKYLDFQGKVENLEVETSHLGSPLSYKQLENIHEKLMEQIEASLDSFSKSLFENLEKSQGPKKEKHEETKDGDEPVNQQIFNIKNVKVQQHIDLSAPLGWDSIEYIEDLNMIVMGNDLGNLELWSTLDFKLISSTKIHQSYLNCVKYSKKTNKIITASLDKLVNVIDIQPGPTLKVVKTLKNHMDKVYAILIIESLDIFISSGRDPDLRTWDLNTFSFKYKISTNGKDYMGTKMEYIAKSGLIAVTFKQGLVCLYDIKTGNEVASVSTQAVEWMHSLSYLEKSEELLVGVGKGKIMAWKVNGKKLEPSKSYLVPGDIPCSIVPVNDEQSVILSSKTEAFFCLNLSTNNYEASPVLDFKAAIIIKNLANLKKLLIASSINKIAVIDYA